MRIDEPVIPPEEPPHPGFFQPPAEFVVEGHDGRLIPMLRGAARTRDPDVILAWAATEFFRAGRALVADDRHAAEARGTALADLAVTGRVAYDRFRNGLNMLAVEGNTRLRIEAQVVGGLPASDDEIAEAMRRALDRAYAVAWALRGPVGQRAALRARLGWIAVSGEDDKPHRPVNVPAPPYEQYEVNVGVPTPVATGSLRLWTRFLIATADDTPSPPTPVLSRTAPNDLIPNIPSDHKVIVFLHGHSSGAEEALDLIPHLIREGREADPSVKLAILSVDLPNNGYSEPFDHTRVAPASATTFPTATSLNTPVATPILDFIEDFVVAFVDAVDALTLLNGTTRIKERVIAVIGGSLGGNLGLRLGRRANMPAWLDRAIVAWSPASVWKAKVRLHADTRGSVVTQGRYLAADVEDTRQDYFLEVYERSYGATIRPQPEYWYRGGYVPAGLLVALSRLARHEVYGRFFREWHWRVALEQLIYSHDENVVYGDGSTPVRATLNTVRTLLAAGADDDALHVNIYGGTRAVARRMTRARGRLLLVRDCGHSIHFERPQWFAAEIMRFLSARSLEIRCVTRRAGRVLRVGGFDHTAQQPFDLTNEECIAAIVAGAEVFAAAPDGTLAAVSLGQTRIVDPDGTIRGVRTFLRTEADDTDTNNLKRLPDC